MTERFLKEILKKKKKKKKKTKQSTVQYYPFAICPMAVICYTSACAGPLLSRNARAYVTGRLLYNIARASTSYSSYRQQLCDKTRALTVDWF